MCNIYYVSKQLTTHANVSVIIPTSQTLHQSKNKGHNQGLNKWYAMYVIYFNKASVDAFSFYIKPPLSLNWHKTNSMYQTGAWISESDMVFCPCPVINFNGVSG